MTIDFEAGRTWWKHGGAKEAQTRELFGETATRYSQRLNALLDDPAALEYDPATVGRLRRLREARREARSSRRPG